MMFQFRKLNCVSQGVAEDSAHQTAEVGGRGLWVMMCKNTPPGMTNQSVYILLLCRWYLFCTGLSACVAFCPTTVVSELRILFFIFISETFPERRGQSSAGPAVLYVQYFSIERND